MSIIHFKSSLALDEKFAKAPHNIVERKLDDIKRVGKFMYGSIEGALFIGKQVGLQLMNPMQEPNGLKFLNINSTSANRVYNLGVNTMAQVTVQGTGMHLDRHGLVPINEEENKYYKVVASNDKNGTSRMINLTKKLMFPTKNSIWKPGTFSVSNEETQILSYQGGPNSILGVGNTTLLRTYNTTNIQHRSRPDLYTTDFVYLNSAGTKDTEVNYYHQLNLSKKLFLPAQFKEATGVDFDKPFQKPANMDVPSLAFVIGKPLFRAVDRTKLIQDEFDSQYVKPTSNTTLSDSGIDFIDKRVNFETPDGRQFVDGVNLVDIYTSDERKKNEAAFSKAERDLVKLKFELINNDSPNSTDHLVFRSYITSFEDSSSAQWNEINYLGRGDSQYVYNKYTGSYSLAFDIMASSSAEMKSIYAKLNYLKSSLASDYKGTRMRGSLIRLTVGNYLARVPGFIASLNISVPEDAPWDVDIVATQSGSMAKELPRYLKVSLTFTPIYNHLIRKGRNVPFISVDKLGFL